MDAQKYQQLLKEYDTIKDERSRIDLLVTMALEMRNTDQDEAMKMADEIIEKSVNIGYPRGQGRGHNLKGSCYGLQGDYDDGLAELHKAQAIAKHIKDKKLEARVLNNFGNIYRETGDFARALNYFEEALVINEALGDEVATSVNLTSIAQLLYDLNDFDSALDYALRCLPIFEKAHDANRVTTTYNVLGNIYFKREEYEEAMQYFEKNLQSAEQESSAYIIALSGVGKVHYRLNDFEKAKESLEQAQKEAVELENAEVQIICNYYLGKIQMDEGDFRQALFYLNKAFEMAEDYLRKHDVMSLHETLSVLYDKMGNIPSAFYHLKAYEQLKEEIFQQTTLNKLRNLQIRQKIELSQKEKEVAERTAELKQQFMANMSHEIRTPMNAIVGMTRLLMDKDPRDDQKRYLKAIQQSADNLLVIINDILDLSKIEAGKIVIEDTDFVMTELIGSMKDILLFKAEEKGLEFKVSVDEHIPIRLIGDPTRINQVLINLAGNAVKFTEKGSVSVSASVNKREGNKYWIRFDVEDTGIGISPDYVGQIFESFTQAGTDIARKFGGTGLGLTISKQLVGLMNGEISVESELGKGTKFTVIIPLTESANQVPVEDTPIIDDSKKQKLARLKLLLAEDNEFNRMVAEDTLKELLTGIHIDFAVNGQVAVEKVKTGIYDIVLMDIQMPVMDGVEATKRIRKDLPEPLNKVKIIAMTANVLMEDVQKYFDIGMNAYVSKPFQPDELLLKMATVMEHISSPDKQQQVQPNTTAVQDNVLKPLPEKVTDMRFLTQFTGGNVEKIQKYKGMFLENGPRLLNNIDEGLKNKDYPAIKIAAHSMKPQLSYMGVKEDISNIFLIEQTAGEQAHFERLPRLIEQLHKVCEKAFVELKSE
ncbi:MAG: tetratricopeptide repeat protein [Chitinophagaceae bacterium]|nr:tetratricopeptide repeat protein [Chitinophagaceae bacterium]